MGIPWSTFRGQLRRALKAVANTKTWGDDELRDYLNAGLVRFAAHTAPARRVAFTAEGGPLTQVALPDDLLALGPVWFPRRVLLAPIAVVPDSAFPSETVTTTSLPTGYYRWPDEVLNFTQALPEGQTTEIFYWSYWPEVAEDADPLTVPRWALEALEWFVVYKAMGKHGVGQAMLGQWDTKQDAGKPEDNPLQRYAQFAWGEYQKVLADHPAQDRDGWEQPIT